MRAAVIESPLRARDFSLDIDALLREGASVRLYDPEAMPNTQRELPEEPGRVTYCKSAYEAARGAHALLVLTEWDEFRKLDLNQIRNEVALER